MQIILEPYTIPERGTFQIHETVTIQVSADEAKRQVDWWLLHEVNAQMGAEQPTLVVGERSVWRVPVYWSTPHAGRMGMVGNVEVDVLSGEMDSLAQRKTELIQRAQELATGLPAYQPREVPVAYLAKQGVATHKPGRPSGNPRDLLSPTR
jgi:hypothetical protein